MSRWCRCDNNQHEKILYIKNPKSGLVLDASEVEVKLQTPRGINAQLWTLECIQNGRFLIINKGNGNVLDIAGGAKKLAHLITYARHGNTNQQWHINSDGTVASPVDNLVLDISENTFGEGNKIIAFPKHGKENQIFQLEYM